MKILAIDTSTRIGSVALVDGQNLLGQWNDSLEVTHTERLIESVDKVLISASVDIEDVEALAVSIGPGSFTGLRVGMATMKGFAAARKLPLVGVSSLESLAYSAATLENPVCACLNARRKELFAALYRFENGEIIEKLMPETVLSPDSLVEALSSFSEMTILGDGVEAYHQFFESHLPNATHLKNHHPKAFVVAKLGMKKISNGEGANWASLVPNYLREPDVGIVKKRTFVISNECERS